VVHEVPRSTVQAAILTVSDRAAAALQSRIVPAQWVVPICASSLVPTSAGRALCPDEKEQIADVLRDYACAGWTSC